MGLLDWAGENPGEAVGLASRIGAAWSKDKNATRNVNQAYNTSLADVERTELRGVVQALNKLPGDIFKDPQKMSVALHGIHQEFKGVNPEAFQKVVQSWQNTKVAMQNLTNNQAQEDRAAEAYGTQKRQLGEVEAAADQYGRINKNIGTAQTMGGMTGTVTDETGMPNDPRQTASMISGAARQETNALLPQVAAMGPQGAGLLGVIERGQGLPNKLKAEELAIRKTEEEIKGMPSIVALREATAEYYSRDRGKTSTETLSSMKVEAWKKMAGGTATTTDLAMIGQGEDKWFRDALNITMQSEEGMKLFRKTPEEGYAIIKRMADIIRRGVRNEGPDIDPAEQKKNDAWTTGMSNWYDTLPPKK